MRSWLQVGALTLALVGVLVVAAQNKVGSGRATASIEMPAIVDDEITGGIDSLAAAQALALSEEQRGWIFLGVINLPDVPDVDLPALWLTAALPDSVALQELPAMVTSKIPLVKEIQFVKLDDRILLVRPADRIVVGEIPRYRLWQ
jgi:hypothetical protein